MRCEKCSHTLIAYNSCRNRHCPKCQGAAAKEWLAEREAELLPVPYYHVVFTLPAAIADIAYQNKAVIYNLLFKASAETLITVAADPKHLARVGILSVLHTWGSALTHHPHLHMIVPGGGIALDGKRWLSCRPGFFLPVRVLSRLFRRLLLEKLAAAHRAGELQFLGIHAPLDECAGLRRVSGAIAQSRMGGLQQRPFGGPKEVLRYLARYTHRVAISNSRLIVLDDNGVTFKWKDYRIEGRERYKVMTLATNEFIRRFLIHVLPQGFHRIRYYGLLANTPRADNIARARELLAVPKLPTDAPTPPAPMPANTKTQASMPLLRRPHDHHRDLRARQLAQISSAADTRNQDRYLMTRAPKPRRRKATCLLRWFQTGHDGARQNRASTLRLTRQPSTVDPAIPSN